MWGNIFIILTWIIGTISLFSPYSIIGATIYAVLAGILAGKSIAELMLYKDEEGGTYG